ncbi:HD domain-containing protein [bacterium]|jgi:hypothetical protein|nr:HD domain-containing protein [bacterium]
MKNSREKFDKIIELITRSDIKDLVSWLETTDFFTAPASTKYHGNYEGGLLDHSLNVTYLALNNFNFILKCKPDLEYLRESVIISALFHDVCKVNFYVKKEKWRKDANNRWESYLGWETDDKFPIGHGEKSVYLISKYMQLTDPEVMAIRWHMGTSETSTMTAFSPQNYSYYAALDHPLVNIIQCADMLAMSIDNKVEQ